MAEGRVSKKIKQGKVDIDFQDCALLVNYDLEMVQTDANGMVMSVLDRKSEVRRIKIKTLSVDKNMAQLASDIVDKCKYIHPSRTEEIEQLLIQLQKHTLTDSGKTNDTAPTAAAMQINDHHRDNGRYGHEEKLAVRGSDADGGRRDRDRGEKSRESGRRSSKGATGSSSGGGGVRSVPAPSLPPAYIDDLDDYLDMLYQVSGKNDKEKEESLRTQERGTGMILQLCRDVMNLEQLIQNSTVMGALTRVLQEEYKKSIDLTFNILRIFLAFSNFMEMHSLMANYRIGVLTMKAIEFEIKRTEVRDAEHTDREAALTAELDSAKRNDPDSYPEVLDRVRRKREKEAAKQAIFSRKQDKLLFVGFYILLNLAEDIGVERKMVRKQLMPSLVAMLRRRFEDLLILVVTFLKKLSTVEENKEAMKSLGVMDQVVKIISCSSQPLVTITLRLLFNLSFDKEMRELMLKSGMVPKLVNLLKTPSYRAKTLKLLYHLSADDRCKSMITYTDGIPILMGLVINFPQDFLAKELAALMVNLSYNARNAEMMVGNKGLNLLMDRFADKRDPLLLKIIRNLTLWTFNQQQELENPELNYSYRGLWSPHVKTLLEVLREEDRHDLLVEVIGCLANMTVYDLPATSNWAKLTRSYNLLSMFAKMLVPGMSQNDLVLEIIMLVSTIASDAQACELIASSSLVGQLYQLWQEKSEDTEILLQLIHCFHKLFMVKSSREEAMYSTRVVVDIIECLNHRSAAIRNKAYKMCEIVLEFDRGKDGEPGNLGRKIIQKQFESYNKNWLEVVMPEVSEQLHMQGDMPVADEYLMSPSRGGRRLGPGQEEEDEDVDEHGQLNHLNSARFFNDKLDSSMEWKLDSQMPYNGNGGGSNNTSSAMIYDGNEAIGGGGGRGYMMQGGGDYGGGYGEYGGSVAMLGDGGSVDGMVYGEKVGEEDWVQPSYK